MKRLLIILLILTGMSIVACSSEITMQPSPDTSERVITVNMGHFNIYFVRTADGYLLVDTGMPGEASLQEAFVVAGVSPDEVKLIVLTHGHTDHIGAVAYAKEITGAELLCHEYTAEYVRQGKSVPAIAHDLRGRFFNLISPTTYPAAEPDIVMQEEFDLQAYGIDGKIVHTPGHSQGSVAIVLDNGEMLLGDLVRGTEPEIHLGSYYEDKDVLIQSLEKLAAYDADKIYLSHGASIDNAALLTCIEELKG